MHYVSGGFGYEIAGLRELESVLKRLPKQYRRAALTKALTTAGQPTLALAQANAPDSGTEHKNSLRESIHIATRLNKNQRRQHARLVEGAEIFLGSDAPHAHLVEFGTAERYRSGRRAAKAARKGLQVSAHSGTGSSGRMPAKPFLTQAWDATKHEALAILKKELWVETERAVKRLTGRVAKGTLSIRAMREMQRM